MVFSPLQVLASKALFSIHDDGDERDITNHLVHMTTFLEFRMDKGVQGWHKWFTLQKVYNSQNQKQQGISDIVRTGGG